MVDLGDLLVPSARIVIMCPSGDKGHMEGLEVAILDYKILKEEELGAHACTESTKYYVCH